MIGVRIRKFTLLLFILSLSACSGVMESSKDFLYAVGVTTREQREIQTRYIGPVETEFEEALDSIGLGMDTAESFSELGEIAKQMFSSSATYRKRRKAPGKTTARATSHQRTFRDSVDGFLSGLGRSFSSAEESTGLGFERF